MSSRQDYDIVVIGASFAGSVFAQSAASQGARVLVLEKDLAVGRVVHTTGIIIAEMLELLDIPPQLLLDGIKAIRVFSPERTLIELHTREARYWMSDTGGLLRWLSDEAQAAGAELLTGARFTDAQPTAGGVRAYYLSNGQEHKVQGRFLVGADGPLSRVGEVSRLHRNRRFLAGAEWIVEGASLPSDTINLIFDRTLAPGYCAWLAPHGKQAALGVAGYSRRYNPHQALHQAESEFTSLLGISKL